MLFECKRDVIVKINVSYIVKSEGTTLYAATCLKYNKLQSDFNIEGSIRVLMKLNGKVQVW